MAFGDAFLVADGFGDGLGDGVGVGVGVDEALGDGDKGSGVERADGFLDVHEASTSVAAIAAMSARLLT